MGRRVRQILTGLWAGPAWASVIISGLLVVERTYLLAIPRWVFVVVLVLSLILAAIQTLGPALVRSHFASELLWILLSDLMTALPSALRQDGMVRCNVMHLQKGVLTTVATWPERSLSSNDLTWSTDQGCCGLAVRKGQPIIQDLSRYTGQSYDALIDPEDGLPKWGLTREQWDHTRDLAAIVSIPLLSVDVRPTVIGVLNFDARVSLEEWLGVGGKEELLSRVQIIRRVLAMTLQATAAKKDYNNG